MRHLVVLGVAQHSLGVPRSDLRDDDGIVLDRKIDTPCAAPHAEVILGTCFDSSGTVRARIPFEQCLYPRHEIDIALIQPFELFSGRCSDSNRESRRPRKLCFDLGELDELRHRLAATMAKLMRPYLGRPPEDVPTAVRLDLDDLERRRRAIEAYLARRTRSSGG